MLITQIQGNAGPGVSGLPCSWEGGELEGNCALLITVIAPSLLGVEQDTVLALSGAYPTIHPSISRGGGGSAVAAGAGTRCQQMAPERSASPWHHPGCTATSPQGHGARAWYPNR